MRVDPVLAELEYGVARVPLAAPYHLSFATLEAYDAVWVWYRDADGGEGLGEAVPLPGYGWERLDDVREAVAAMTREAVGRPRSFLVRRCRAWWAEHPFAASAVLSAAGMPGLLRGASGTGVFPLNWPVAGSAPAQALTEHIREGLRRGYGFLKVKVGKDLDSELANLPLLFGDGHGRPFRILFDANQGFDPAQALAFARGLARWNTGALLWFEQPLPRDDWDGLAALCARSPVPILLDESIYSGDDVRRAARIGAHGVKLKLFKQCGPKHCLALSRLAARLGLAAVFGNGVATDIGNMAEYLVLARAGGLFAAPAEANGFCKLAAPLLGGVIAERQGNLTAAVSATEMLRRMQTFFRIHHEHRDAKAHLHPRSGL